MVKLTGFGFDNNGYIKRNFVINVLDGSIFAFGMNFVSLTTILPLLVKQMGGSNISIGLIPVVWALGFNFPQIFIANYARKQTMKKSLVMKTALFQRIPWLLLSVFAFFLFSRLSSEKALLLFFTGFGLAAVGGAINMPAWFTLVFKVTPVKLRGRLFALRLTLGALFGIFAGGVAKIVLDSYSYPNGFSLLFLLAFLMMMISYTILAQLKEERISPPLNLVRYKEFLLGLPTILRHEKNFRNYLIGDSLMVCAGMAHAFFTVFAFDKFLLSPGYAGQFTIVMMISTIFGSLFFGFLADKYGHRINLIFSAGFILISINISTYNKYN